MGYVANHAAQYVTTVVIYDMSAGLATHNNIETEDDSNTSHMMTCIVSLELKSSDSTHWSDEIIIGHKICQIRPNVLSDANPDYGAAIMTIISPLIYNRVVPSPHRLQNGCLPSVIE